MRTERAVRDLGQLSRSRSPLSHQHFWPGPDAAAFLSETKTRLSADDNSRTSGSHIEDDGSREGAMVTGTEMEPPAPNSR